MGLVHYHSLLDNSRFYIIFFLFIYLVSVFKLQFTIELFCLQCEPYNKCVFDRFEVIIDYYFSYLMNHFALFLCLPWTLGRQLLQINFNELNGSSFGIKHIYYCFNFSIPLELVSRLMISRKLDVKLFKNQIYS